MKYLILILFHILSISIGQQFQQEQHLMKHLFEMHFPAIQKQKATIKHPVEIISFINKDTVLISSFLSNQIIIYNIKTKNSQVLIEDHYYCNIQKQCIKLDGPYGMILLPSSTLSNEIYSLYVASFTFDNINVFDINITDMKVSYIYSFGDSETLDCPQGITFNPLQQVLYVTSFLDNQITLFNISNGIYLDKINFYNNKNIILNGPENLKFDNTFTYLYISSYYTNTILKYNIFTDTIEQIISNENLLGPTGLYITSTNELLVASYKTNQIIKFSSINNQFAGIYTRGFGVSNKNIRILFHNNNYIYS